MDVMAKVSLTQAQALISSVRRSGESVGSISDGNHTFDELYEHRTALFIALCKDQEWKQGTTWSLPVWRTKVYSDGSVWDGWFLLGMGVSPGTQITYHLPISKWDECSFATELVKAPVWDGHTSQDVLQRLKTL